jgi:mono/diheme cytochrome c family protein
MDLKHVILILSVEVSMTGCMLAQMPGMANHHQQPPKATIAPHQNSNVTFTKDIAPIVQQHCQSCHRPGEGTPFSLLTYESAKPWADDIKDMVQQRAMPPWFEVGHTEKFENNPSLTQAQIDTIVAWVNAGAPKGNPKDMPEAPHFIQGFSGRASDDIDGGE